ncbi:hypothetical protein NMY22_g10571 [Coprinellus aureogranulatus]|nr:hypothetical protein NMY22_g10571 [Coprinellus aureogranulatus]
MLTTLPRHPRTSGSDETDTVHRLSYVVPCEHPEFVADLDSLFMHQTGLLRPAPPLYPEITEPSQSPQKGMSPSHHPRSHFANGHASLGLHVPTADS